jgi:DNA repair protein RadA/Sms
MTREGERVERSRYVCQACGHVSAKWLGRCPGCGEWNTLAEEVVRAAPRPTRPPAAAAEPVSVAAGDLTQETRTTSGLAEFDRVLGGGLVAGSVVLVGGDPGVGKSTLLTLIAHRLAQAGRPVLYVTAEESVRQTRLRAERLGALAPALLLLAETDLDVIAETVRRVRPTALVVDSIQTVYRSDVASAPGSVAQVRECAALLVRLAKDERVATFLVGHVTKEGALAGPRVLEHLVDTVLYVEGDRHHAYRVLRATKNRFGPTHEIGVFEMTPTGLVEVPNPSAAFLSERPAGTPGSAVVCAIEGTRPLLVEVQALVTPTHFGMPRRTASGVDYNRLVLLLAVLERRAGLRLADQDVYVSVAGGLTVEEPAADLGVALAVASSLRDRAVDPRTVVVGEVGLAGEVRTVPQLARRVAEAARLGFARVVVPARAVPDLSAGLEVVGVRDLGDALRVLL